MNAYTLCRHIKDNIYVHKQHGFVIAPEMFLVAQYLSVTVVHCIISMYKIDEILVCFLPEPG